MSDSDNVDNGVANPGSTLGEAVGALVESELKRLLKPIAEDNRCIFVAAGKNNPRTGKATKLTLKDAAGNEYQIDAVIANERMQPLVLIESKYIRYTKHNRDKGSWVCTAHYSLRRTFPSVRKSIAVLAGNWSRTSKAMMRSFGVTLFQVEFAHIVTTLHDYGIEFDWGEKERHKAIKAWGIWQTLTDEQYQEIAHKLLAAIEPEIRASLTLTLNTAIPREIYGVEIAVETNLGERRLYNFTSMIDAVTFLQAFDADEVLNNTDDPAIWSTDNDES